MQALTVQQFSCPISKYHYFKVYEPKERQIMALPFYDRVVQHAINNVLPDTDELDGDSTTGSVEEHRTQER